MTNEQLIKDFYTSFQKLDGNGMEKCYHEDIIFSDPIFTNLKGKDASRMWKMLCRDAKKFELTFSDIVIDGEEGKAHWEAKYKFITGKNIHNKIDATFKFKDGKIIEHKDEFDVNKWINMAFGVFGKIFGKILIKKVRKEAQKGLNKFKG